VQETVQETLQETCKKQFLWHDPQNKRSSRSTQSNPGTSGPQSSAYQVQNRFRFSDG